MCAHPGLEHLVHCGDMHDSEHCLRCFVAKAKGKLTLQYALADWPALGVGMRKLSRSSGVISERSGSMEPLDRSSFVERGIKLTRPQEEIEFNLCT